MKEEAGRHISIPLSPLFLCLNCATRAGFTSFSRKARSTPLCPPRKPTEPCGASPAGANATAGTCKSSHDMPARMELAFFMPALLTSHVPSPTSRFGLLVIRYNFILRTIERRVAVMGEVWKHVCTHSSRQVMPTTPHLSVAGLAS
jgi:hypothetical protein